jgi:acyl dehydratase
MNLVRNIVIGTTVSATRAFSDGDVRTFAALTGDNNPVHLDEAFADTTRFGRRIVQGILASSMFSALIASDLPGAGAIYMEQSLAFKKPVYLDSEVTATLTVVEIPKPGIYRLSTTIVDAQGDIAITGHALVWHRAERRE